MNAAFSFSCRDYVDASQAHGNKDTKPNFASAVASLVHKKSGSSGDGDSGGNNDDQKSKTKTKTKRPSATTTKDPTPTFTSTTSSDYITTTTKSTTATTVTKTTTHSKEETAIPTSPGDDDNHGDDGDDDSEGDDDGDGDDDDGKDEDEDDNDSSCVQDGDSCSEPGKYVCTDGGFAVCVQDQWVVTPCAVGLTCLSTTDGESIYCAQSDNDNGGDGTCDAKSSRKRALSYINNPRPYKSARVTAQFLVTHIDKNEKQYNAIINARRLDTKAFGSKVVVEMKMPSPSNITVDSVTNGQVKQTDQMIKIQVNNPNRKSMALVFGITGSIPDGGVFVAPDVNSMKFMT